MTQRLAQAGAEAPKPGRHRCRLQNYPVRSEQSVQRRRTTSPRCPRTATFAGLVHIKTLKIQQHNEGCLASGGLPPAARPYLENAEAWPGTLPGARLQGHGQPREGSAHFYDFPPSGLGHFFLCFTDFPQFRGQLLPTRRRPP